MSSKKRMFALNWHIMITVIALSLLCILLVGYMFTESPSQLRIEKMKFAAYTNSTNEEYRIIESIKFGGNAFYIVQIQPIPSHSHSFVHYLETIHLAHNTNNRSNCRRSIYNLFAHQCCAVQHTVNYLYSLGFTHVQFARRARVSEFKTLFANHNHSIGCLGLHIAENKQIAFAHLDTLADKTVLYHTVMTYCNKYNITTCTSWLPMTYDLQITDERLMFFNELSCGYGPDREWLLKTSIHQGRGVQLINNPNALRKFYLKPSELQQSNCEVEIDDSDSSYQNISQQLDKQAVGQKLISNALKYKGCSFHIRSVFVLASYGAPRLVFYIRSYGVRSLDPSEFRSNAHQTFSAEETHDLSLQTLADYFGERFDIEDVSRQIINAGKSIFGSVLDGYHAPWKHLQHYARPALDLLVTDQFEIKFLDFNPHHGTTAANCYEEIKDIESNSTKVVFKKNIWQCVESKRTMEEMVDIQIEIAMKKENNVKIDVLESQKTFRTVIWEY
eukprot:89415_1